MVYGQSVRAETFHPRPFDSSILVAWFRAPAVIFCEELRGYLARQSSLGSVDGAMISLLWTIDSRGSSRFTIKRRHSYRLTITAAASVRIHSSINVS
jgi:hypothetical protein